MVHQVSSRVAVMVEKYRHISHFPCYFPQFPTVALVNKHYKKFLFLQTVSLRSFCCPASSSVKRGAVVYPITARKDMVWFILVKEVSKV